MGSIFEYKLHITREQKLAFASAFLFTLLIHLYKFTNTLPNHDSLYNYYSDQNVLGSGRWALSLACGISSFYDLPWVIGLLCCLWIALTAVVVVMVLRLHNPVLIILCGGLLAAAPSTTETFFFLFTADGYMLAMLLAALGVYFSRIEETRTSRWILSAVCICISCGIYQAYVSFALILAVCYFMLVLLNDEFSKADCLRWVLRQAVIYICALAAYYGIWKLMLFLTGTPVNNYQGISEVGSISLSLLLGGIPRAIQSVLLYFLQWNILEQGLTLYSVLSILFLLILAGILLRSVRKSGILQRWWAVILLTLCLAAIIPFACIWHFVSDSVGYRPMMLQCLTILFLFCAVLCHRWASTAVQNLAVLLISAIIFNNSLMANISYFYLHQCYERTYAEGIEMMIAIHDLQKTEEFDRIAIIGSRLTDLALKTVDSDTGEALPPGNLQMLSMMLEESLLLGEEHTYLFLHNTFDMDLSPATYSESKALSQTAQFKAMPCWPDSGSLDVVDGILILKLSDNVTEANDP